MAKEEKVDKNPALENLKGFFRRGASTRSPGNIPTGHFELDFVLHHGISPKDVDLNSLEGYDPSIPLGLPLGKLIELFGEEGAGKSSVAYRVCGYAQKMGLDCVWIDVENSFSDDLALINGVVKEDLIFSDLINDEDPDAVYCAEDVFDSIIQICKRNSLEKDAKGKKIKKIGVVVLDSVANLIPKARMEATADQHTVGVVARLMSENLKKVVNHAAKYGVLVIFINQLRDKIGVMFGNPETTPGGKALKFNASMRLRVGKKSGKEANITTRGADGREILLGRRAYIRIEKNRFAKPYTGDTIEIPIYYENYFPDVSDMMFDVARQLKIIKPYNKEFRWKEAEIAAEGKADFLTAVKIKKLESTLLSQIASLAKEQNVLLPPELEATIAEMMELKMDEDLSGDPKAGDLTAEDEDGSEVEKSTRRKRKTKDSPEGE